MTIALGILARGGLVIAADSQETHHGFIKLESGKLSSVLTATNVDSPRGHVERSCIVTGAGDAKHIEAITDAITKLYYYGEDKKTEELEVECQEIVKAFYLEHVVPFGGWPEMERPNFSLIVGTALPRPKLWVSEKTLLRDGGLYAAVGIGATVASPLLQRMYQLPLPDVRTAIALAAYVMSQTKELVEGCGRSTDIAGVNNGEYFALTRYDAKKLEDAMYDYRYAVDPLLLRQLTMRGVRAQRRAATTAKRQLTKALECLDRFIPLGGKPVQPSPTDDPPDQLPSPESHEESNES